MTRWIDFDDLIYLQMDHSPGYKQWWVMANLGDASVGETPPRNYAILHRFGDRHDAERFKEKIFRACIKHKDHNQPRDRADNG